MSLSGQGCIAEGMSHRRNEEQEFECSATAKYQHLKSYTNCECGVHILPSWNLEAHYATSDPHPKCERCGYGFKDEEQFHLVSIGRVLIVNSLDRLSHTAWQHLYDCFRERPEDTKEDPQPEPSPALNSTSLLPDEAVCCVLRFIYTPPMLM